MWLKNSLITYVETVGKCIRTYKYTCTTKHVIMTKFYIYILIPLIHIKQLYSIF